MINGNIIAITNFSRISKPNLFFWWFNELVSLPNTFLLHNFFSLNDVLLQIKSRPIWVFCCTYIYIFLYNNVLQNTICFDFKKKYSIILVYCGSFSLPGKHLFKVLKLDQIFKTQYILICLKQTSLLQSCCFLSWLYGMLVFFNLV